MVGFKSHILGIVKLDDIAGLNLKFLTFFNFVKN